MKKILIVFVSLILNQFYIYSQNEPDTTYWGISIYSSIDLNTHTIKGSTSDGQDAAFMKNIDLPRCGYTLGISVNRPVYKRLSLELGVAFQDQGYRTATLSDTIWNYRDSAIQFNDYHKAYRYYSVNIPLLLKINMFHVKKIAVDFSVGVAPVFSFGKRQVLFFADHKEIVNEKAGRDLNLQALAGVSVYVPLNDKWSVTLEPVLRYNVLPYKDSYYQGISRNLISAGLGIYLTYKWTDAAMYEYYYRNIYNKDVKPNF